MNPTQSLDEAFSALLAEFARLTNTDDEKLELESLRSKWRRIEEWAIRAEQFLSKNDATLLNSSAELLEDAIDEARAELTLTPEGLMKAVAQAARGEGISVSVLRAELERRRTSGGRPMAV